MKRLLSLVLCAVLLAGCAPAAETPAPAALTFTDDLGYNVSVQSWERVVSLYGSFAETWLLAGGTLVGATSDAIEERGLDLGEDTAVVGSVKEPNLEEILACEPDFVILSADIAGQTELHETLSQLQIPHAYYRVDTFDDYLTMLEQFCAMTGRQDLFDANGLAVQKQIRQVLEVTAGQPKPSVLLLRAYSTGAKAKGADNLAGVILEDLGAKNLVEQYDSLLEDLSLEEIIAADPDFIFVTVMGANEDAALENLEQTLGSSPAWSQLSAVKNGRYLVLPKNLFHYKPNARWGESYAYLAALLYPELADQIQ